MAVIVGHKAMTGYAQALASASTIAHSDPWRERLEGTGERCAQLPEVMAAVGDNTLSHIGVARRVSRLRDETAGECVPSRHCQPPKSAKIAFDEHRDLVRGLVAQVDAAQERMALAG